MDYPQAPGAAAFPVPSRDSASSHSASEADFITVDSTDNGPQSFDSIFIDDDADEYGERDISDDFDDGSFTMIDSDIPQAAHQPDVDARQHLRRHHHMREPTSTDKMKHKILSFWQTMKYGWTVKPKSSFNKKKPIFLLGECYDCREAADIDDDTELQRTLVKFKQDFTSRVWITYRHGFPRITDTQITSDSGWGCMIRSGQMMLAQALVLHFLGRNWNLFSDLSKSSEVMHREIVRWFADQPSQRSPFSIHRMVNIGKSQGRKAGDWYGPSTVATILEKACQISHDFVPLLKQVCLYVAHDCTIYKKDVIDLASGAGLRSSTESTGGESWRATILIIPVRLGTENLNPIYIPCLKGLFVHPDFLGIIGGRPGHSLYFVGFQDNKLIHLDPHLMQDTVDTSPREFPVQSYHCVYPRKCSFTSMDPSCALGFYCRTREDFENFLKTVQPYLLPPGLDQNYPMFTVSEGSRSEHFH